VYEGSFFPTFSPTFVGGDIVDGRVRWNLTVVLICISFIAREVHVDFFL
jgi:hypothetical protein